MQASDWPTVQAIYREGIATGQATFEQDPPEWDRWDASHHPTCRLVAVERDGIVGWAALAPVSTRRAYHGVAEVSVYVAARTQGRGVGRALLRELIAASERAGFWTLQAAIFPENVASIALHVDSGFTLVGRRERLAQLAGRWRDVLLLERRSRAVGV